MQQFEPTAPLLNVLLPGYKSEEVNILFTAIENVNHCVIAYQALLKSFLSNQVTKDIRYKLSEDQIVVHSLALDKPVAVVCFPNPVSCKSKVRASEAA